MRIVQTANKTCIFNFPQSTNMHVIILTKNYTPFRSVAHTCLYKLKKSNLAAGEKKNGITNKLGNENFLKKYMSFI